MSRTEMPLREDLSSMVEELVSGEQFLEEMEATLRRALGCVRALREQLEQLRRQDGKAA